MFKNKSLLIVLTLVLICFSIEAQNQQWLWANDGGSAGSVDTAYGIARDADGIIYLTGTFNSPGYFGDTVLSGPPFCGDEIVVGKLTPQGQWAWAARAGGLGSDTGYSIAVDAGGTIWVAGRYDGTSYPHADFGIHSLTGSGAFIGKLNQSGAWMGVFSLPGYIFDMVLDSQGNCYVTGMFSGTASFGDFTLSSLGNYDIFIAKLTVGGFWQWAVRAGGYSEVGLEDRGNGIALDSAGNIYATGYFCGSAGDRPG